jgi:hypothetical protein
VKNPPGQEAQSEQAPELTPVHPAMYWVLEPHEAHALHTQGSTDLSNQLPLPHRLQLVQPV